MFEKVFTPIVGYKPQDFQFIRGKTTLSAVTPVAVALVLYYVITLGGREVMRNQKAMKLNGIFQLHNLLLTGISGALLALFIEQLVPTVYRHGIFYAICNRNGGWTRQLVILYYVGSSE